MIKNELGKINKSDMIKKRFSLIIDDKVPIQEQPSSRLKNNKDTEKKLERIPSKHQLRYWLIQNKIPFLHRTYGININYNNQKSIQYLLEVKCEGFKKGIFKYTLTRKRFFKDNKQLEGVLEQLAEQSASCLYPLQVNVNEHGQIIAVTNQKDIEKRWEKLKPELSKRYAGKPFMNHCKKIDEAISTPDQILKSLNNDVVYDILFSKLYFNYSKAFAQPLEKSFKWFSGIQKVCFTGEQSVNPVIKENKRMIISYNGVMHPIGGLTNGDMSIEYQLNAEDHTLLRLDGTFNYSINNQSKTIEFKAIWQQNMDETEIRRINEKKRTGEYEAPNVKKKWYEFWK